jgi:hypothetical protein
MSELAESITYPFLNGSILCVLNFTLEIGVFRKENKSNRITYVEK